MRSRIAKLRGRTSQAMRVIWWLAVMLFVAIGTGPWARAKWAAHMEGPDAYGEPAFVAVSAAPSGDALLVLCDQNNLLALAYLIPGTSTELSEMSKPGTELPVTLLLKIGDGGQIRVDAQLRRWNNKYLAAIAGGRTGELTGLVREIGSSSRAISVGMDILGDKQGESFDSTGSADAMGMAIKDCKLGDVSARPAGDAASAASK
jgi:hypothetical protein